jgi:hypothetical protein
MELRSFKLRLADGHVRVVPKTDARGCPFSGPGVDLRGPAAEAAFRAAAPLLAGLAAIEPGIKARSIAVDLERPRVTATLDPIAGAADLRPRVVRIDEGPLLRRLLSASQAAIEHLSVAATAALDARASTSRAAVNPPHDKSEEEP